MMEMSVQSDFEEAAEALIKQFPCIADRGTPKGGVEWSPIQTRQIQKSSRNGRMHRGC